MALVSFLHAADLHLEAPFQNTSSFDDQWLDRLYQSTWDAFDNIINLAISNQVDFLIISGDIFDQEGYNAQAKRKFLGRIKRLSEHNIHSYIIFGNHDLLTDYNEIRNFLEQDQYIYVFSNDKVEAITHYRNKVAIARLYGRGFRKESPFDNPAVDYIETINNDNESDLLKVAIAHGRVGDVEKFLPCASYSLAELKATNIHYWAMGHVHKSKVNIEPLPLVVNPGSIQGTNTDELNSKGCYLVKWYGNKLVGFNFHSIEALRWKKIIFNFNNYNERLKATMTIDDIVTILSKQFSNLYDDIKKPLIIQLVFEGQAILSTQFANLKLIESIKQRLSTDDVLVIEILDHTIPQINYEQYENISVLERFLAIIEAVKSDYDMYKHLEESLQLLYGDVKFQIVTETKPNQRGRGQWKLKKIKKDWLIWLDQAKKLGINLILLNNKTNNNDVSLSETCQELTKEQEMLFRHNPHEYIPDATINRLMYDYEQISEEYNSTKNNACNDNRVVILNSKRYRCDGELFSAVRQWTVITMAKWALSKI